MGNVSPDALARLAGMQRPKDPVGGGSGWTYDAGAMLEANDADLEALGIATGKEKPHAGGGRLWELTGCPYSQDHDDSAFRIQYPDGGVHVGCHHGRCQGKTIKTEPQLFRRTLAVKGTPPPAVGDVTLGGEPIGRAARTRANGTDVGSEPGGADVPGRAPERFPVVLSLENVEEKPIDWLWRGWLARSMLTILGGYGGDGKSTLTMALTAYLTQRNGILPDGARAPLLNVLILAAEDDPAYAIKPRLRIHGADMARVRILKGIATANGSDEWVNIARDAEMMREAIHTHDIDLVIIDPLSSYMPKADRNSEGDVRDALMPLQVLMEQTGVAVLGIMHVGKSDAQRKAAQRLLGSTAFTALARCVWMVHDLPDEHQPEQSEDTSGTAGRRKVLGVVKANYSLKPPALAWSQPLDGAIVWHGKAPIGIDETFAADTARPAPKRSEAETFLREFLKGGSKPSREVFAAAKDRRPPIGEKTLRDAAERIRVERIKAGFQGQTLWSLPRDLNDPQTPESPNGGKNGSPDCMGESAKVGDHASPSNLGSIPLRPKTAKIANFEDSRANQPTGTDGSQPGEVKI